MKRTKICRSFHLVWVVCGRRYSIANSFITFINCCSITLCKFNGDNQFERMVRKPLPVHYLVSKYRAKYLITTKGDRINTAPHVLSGVNVSGKLCTTKKIINPPRIIDKCRTIIFGVKWPKLARTGCFFMCRTLRSTKTKIKLLLKNQFLKSKTSTLDCSTSLLFQLAMIPKKTIIKTK